MKTRQHGLPQPLGARLGSSGIVSLSSAALLAALAVAGCRAHPAPAGSRTASAAPARPGGQARGSGRSAARRPARPATARPATARPAAKTRRAASPTPAQRRVSAVMHPKGVGNLRLGQRIPASYLRPGARPQRYYELGLHADAQTYDGFRFPAVPALVIFEEGPFTEWFDSPKRKGGGRPSAALRRRFAARAVRQARAGVKIAWIVVDRPGITTAKGVGVGSTLTQVRQAYGSVKLLVTPPDFGRDRCAVRLAPPAHLWAYFPTCQAARAGATVTRLSVWRRRKK